MRKMVFGRQLSRSRKARKALFRSLIRGLILGGKIQTSKAKAKSVQSQIDKLLNLAKEGSVSARRTVLSELGNDKEVTKIIFNKIAPSFVQRKSGFTRIVLLKSRTGDSAQMVRLEWVENIDLKAKEKKEKPKKESKKKVKGEKTHTPEN